MARSIRFANGVKPFLRQLLRSCVSFPSWLGRLRNDGLVGDDQQAEKANFVASYLLAPDQLSFWRGFPVDCRGHRRRISGQQRAAGTYSWARVEDAQHTGPNAVTTTVMSHRREPNAFEAPASSLPK